MLEKVGGEARGSTPAGRSPFMYTPVKYNTQGYIYAFSRNTTEAAPPRVLTAGRSLTFTRLIIRELIVVQWCYTVLLTFFTAWRFVVYVIAASQHMSHDLNFGI